MKKNIISCSQRPVGNISCIPKRSLGTRCETKKNLNRVSPTSGRRLKFCRAELGITLLFLSSLLFATELERQIGSISGTLIDGITQQPLVGANVVVVEQPTFGTVTASDGSFTIKGLLVGEYSVRTSLLGYKSAVLTNIVVSTGRSTKVKIRMYEEAVSVGEVVVQADYFSSEGTISPISSMGLNGAEVKRSPGSVQDMQRIVQNLPGVANSNDQTNELIVRGGAPDENLTVMDYIEIPTTNHYPNQFNSGGPINMVNVDMIEDLRFSTGAFPANYGDKLSSVMDISLREGDKERTLAGEAGFNMAGIGTLLEGGFAEGKGTWMLSVRQSLLEFADQIVGMSAIGLTAIPKYYDIQFKTTYEISPTQKLIASGIYGNDKILFEGKPDETDEKKANRSDSSGVETVDDKQQQYAVGISLKSLWGRSGYSVLSLYTLNNSYNVAVHEQFVHRIYDSKGKVVSFTPISSYPVFKNNSVEQLLYIKYDAVWEAIEWHEINFGGRAGTNMKFKNEIFFNTDTIRYDVDRNGVWDDTVSYLNARVNYVFPSYEHYKAGVYFSDKIQLSEQLSTTLGLRYDYFTYSEKGEFSPRIAISYELQPLVTKVNVAYGEYYQTLPYPFYGDILKTDKNRYLENSHARHVVAGIERVLDEGLKATVELYYKEYDKLPVEEEYIYSADKTFRSDKMLSIGKRTAKGIDFFLQQKQVSDYYGTVSFTYSKTTDTDPRVNINTFPAINVGSYPSQYDYPYLFTFVAGKVVKDFRALLDETPFFIKYPTMILPFSDDMEISFRFRYASGKPYTPRVFNPFQQHRVGNTTWSAGMWTQGGEINSARFPDYQRLDVQWLSRWHEPGYNIVVFIAIQNIYNRKNIAGYQYNGDGTKDNIYQFAFFPVGGVVVEF